MPFVRTRNGSFCLEHSAFYVCHDSMYNTVECVLFPVLTKVSQLFYKLDLLWDEFSHSSYHIHKETQDVCLLYFQQCENWLDVTCVTSTFKQWLLHLVMSLWFVCSFPNPWTLNPVKYFSLHLWGMSCIARYSACIWPNFFVLSFPKYGALCITGVWWVRKVLTD